MIVHDATITLLESIDVTVEHRLDHIHIRIQWSANEGSKQWIVAYADDQCTVPSENPLFYLCSSSNQQRSINPSFYAYWFLLESSFYQRLFAHLTVTDEQFVLFISLADGRILALPQSPKTDDATSLVWYTSSNRSPISLLGIDYDANRNLLDAVLSSSNTHAICPKVVVNHLLLCEHVGSVSILNTHLLHRVLLDNTIRSACVYASNFLYVTKNELRSISISCLLKPANDDVLHRTKHVRFGHFEKLIVDGQEIVLYHESGSVERLSNLFPASSTSLRTHSIANQTKKLACLTTTITNLQANAATLQRTLNKIDVFYQLDLNQCLKFVHHQWKFVLNEQQLRIFQPNDFLLILLCHLSSNEFRIYQLTSTSHWLFTMKDPLSATHICQPMLVLRHQNEVHCQLGSKRILLPLHEQPDDDIDIEHYFTHKFQSAKKPSSVFHLALTIRNEAALHFRKMNIQLARRVNAVAVECKQQDVKVDTDAGLVDALTVQIILSSSCLRQLLLTFSILTELLYGSKAPDDKQFVKQTDIVTFSDLVQAFQTKPDALTDEKMLDLLQIRIYLSMFRLGSNYTVQVY